MLHISCISSLIHSRTNEILLCIMLIAFPSLNFTFMHIGLHLYTSYFPSDSHMRGTIMRLLVISILRQRGKLRWFGCTCSEPHQYNEQVYTYANEHSPTERQVKIFRLLLFRTTTKITNNERKYLTRIIVYVCTLPHGEAIQSLITWSQAKQRRIHLHYMLKLVAIVRM